MHYAGVEYESGEEFDSSWGRGESIQFPLRGLIQGWQDGIPGMKVGGRRELVDYVQQARDIERLFDLVEIGTPVIIR